MPRPRTWVFIGLGAFAVLAGGALMLVGASAWYFSRHVQVQAADAAAALDSFEGIRGRFEGQAPLFEPDATGHIRLTEFERRRASYTGPLPETLHVTVWDKDDQQMVRIALPFWLLRLRQDGRLKIDVRGVELDTLGITTDDIQMAGPALLLDVETPKHRVLMWTQ